MRSVRLMAAAAALLASAQMAQAADALTLAERGGFLIGHAHRCGIAPERVVRAGKLIKDVVASAATDTTQADQASTHFAMFFLASAYPDKDEGALIPACKTVTAEFRRLEQRGIQLGMGSRVKSAGALSAMVADTAKQPRSSGRAALKVAE